VNAVGQLVLVAEDDVTVRRVVATVLKFNGFDILEARNGLEAVQLYASYAGDIALVITDLDMPVMDGGEAIHRMRVVNSGVRVLVMTGGTLAERPSDCHLLPKPFTPHQLIEAVHAVIDGFPATARGNRTV
jgi:two-component system, cell cycle sensor histidine kinase and response regulator CckA